MTRIALAICGLLLLGACNKKTAEATEQAPQTRQQGRQGGPPNAAQAIAKMDGNSDGKLSISEVKGPLKENFAKIDSNGDGFLTKAELENAPRPQRNGQRPSRG
ncbi:MAG: EF-hand domain-containing protein [Saprospiraceae bacterium]